MIMDRDTCIIKGERFKAELWDGTFTAWVLGEPDGIEIRPHANVPSSFDTFEMHCGSASILLTRRQVCALAKALEDDVKLVAGGSALPDEVFHTADIADVEALRVANATNYVEVLY